MHLNKITTINSIENPTEAQDRIMRDSKGMFKKNCVMPAEWIEKHRQRMFGKNNPFYGKKHSEKTKQIIKEKRALQDMSGRIGLKHSDATKEKISNLKHHEIKRRNR